MFWAFIPQLQKVFLPPGTVFLRWNFPNINPIGCGGGGIRPPYHTFVIPRKKLMGKVANFFFTFPKYENGRLGTTFCSQITSNVVRRGPKWSNLPKFHKGGPCREQQEGKMTNQNRWLIIHVALNFLVIFLMKHLSLGEIWGWEQFLGQSYCYVDIKRGCFFSSNFDKFWFAPTD